MVMPTSGQVLLTTAKYVCLGFEGSIAIAYVVWMRSLAAIWILHLIFARQRTEQSVPVALATVHAG